MTFDSLLHDVLRDTGGSLVLFRPEMVLCAAIVVLLLVRMIVPRWKDGAHCVALIAAAVALYLAAPWQLYRGGVTAPVETFTGLLVCDAFAVYIRSLLLFFLVLFVGITKVSGMPRRDDATEFYVLIFGAVVGMCLMVSANHMLTVFLGIEMASVPCYVLAGFQKYRREGSEAAIKYAVFGAACAGVMLYGISLLVGLLGSAHLPTMAVHLAGLLHETGGQHAAVLALAGLMVMVGLAFKLSAVPFHFWAPDVFEGAPAEIGAFLSVASKAAALTLLARLAMEFSYVDDHAALAALAPVRRYLVGLISLFAVVTCTFGNLAAYGQTNIKRLLAYSTIAHAGYMMMPIAAAVQLVGVNLGQAPFAVASLAFYIAIYLFMNLGAFTVVAFVRNACGSEEIAGYSGMIRTSPAVAVCMSIMLFSLVGLPPLAGFAAKFAIFLSMVDAWLIALIAVAGLNTVLSLFYYLRVVKVMTMVPGQEDRPAVRIPGQSLPGTYIIALTIPLLVFGVFFARLLEWARAALATSLF